MFEKDGHGSSFVEIRIYCLGVRTERPKRTPFHPRVTSSFWNPRFVSRKFQMLSIGDKLLLFLDLITSHPGPEKHLGVSVFLREIRMHGRGVTVYCVTMNWTTRLSEGSESIHKAELQSLVHQVLHTYHA
jgi:hypothetical protein